MKILYIVINIGCIECDVSSGIVGIFTNKDQAEIVASDCRGRLDWKGGGENRYLVVEFDMDNIDKNLYAEISDWSR